MHVKINPMFCNDLSAEGAKLDLYLGRICMYDSAYGLSAGGAKATAYIRLVCKTVCTPDDPPLVCGLEIFLS